MNNANPINETDVFYPYPSQTIDPRYKTKEWVLRYVRAAWSDGTTYIPNSMLYNGRSRYSEIREYALGKQSIQKYKKILLASDQEDESWLSIDWTPPSFLTKFREIAITKILQKQYDVQAFAVDPLSRSEEDERFNEMKIKLMIQEAAQQSGSSLADNPMLKPSVGEPADMEQLKMEQEFGYKHILCMEAEEGIQLIMQQNDIDNKRRRTVENLFDFGIGGYRSWIEYTGMPNFREINPENIITSFCNKNDFSDWVHWGEVIWVVVADLAPYFTEAELNDICRSAAGKYGNSAQFPTGVVNNQKYYDKFKVMVFDIQFLSWNTTIYKNATDGKGNTRFEKSDYKNVQFVVPGDASVNPDFQNADEVGSVQGQATPKYRDSTRKVVYQAKWVIGTDYMYEYGIAPNQARKLSSWWDVNMDANLYSWNFYKMMFTGITERLIPIEDAICLDWYKLQNLKNKLMPYIMNIDHNALESMPMGKGGKVMTKAEVLDFMFQNFIVNYRSTDLIANNPNYKPVSIEATPGMELIAGYIQSIQANIQLMKEIIGLNDFTDGSTPNAKSLVPTVNAAIQSSNNALEMVSNADMQLYKKLAEQIFGKIQISVKMGKVEGFVKPLGSQTVKFLSINPEISLREMGIFLRNMPTDDERALFMQQLNIKDANGLITPADYIICMNTPNLKQAAIYLDYAINKRQKEMQQMELQKIQENNNGQTQMALQMEAAKQKTLQMQLQGQLMIENVKGEWNYRTEIQKKASDQTEALIQSEAKKESARIQASAKMATQMSI